MNDVIVPYAQGAAGKSNLYLVPVDSNRLVVTFNIFFLGLGLTVTEINIKKVQKQENKHVYKRGEGWHAK